MRRYFLTSSTDPDFIIVRRDEQLGYVIDILEPHNPEFKDNLGKAKGLAAYAEKEYRIGRIQLIRKAKDAAGKTRFKRLVGGAALNGNALWHDADGVSLDQEEG